MGQPKEVATLMDDALSQVCGLGERDRKRVTYYTIATHAASALDTFPLLVFRGPMGTGKSQALRVVGAFARQARAFSLRGMTAPTIRDKLAECHDGTAIIEEADQAWKDAETFERMLSDRYQRATAKASFKQPRSDGSFGTVDRQLFGASILHRRLPFADPALNGRSVIVRFRADHSRTYADPKSLPRLSHERVLALQGLTLQLPAVEQPANIAARVFDTYRPLVAASIACGDTGFLASIMGALETETLSLKEAQSIEPEGLVLRALIECVTSFSGESGLSPNFSRYVPLKEMAASIWDNHRVSLRPQQIGAIVRDLGFEAKESHGVTKVVPTPATLLKACTDLGYDEDDVIAEIKQQLT
jgi:hypothetical protein